MLNTEFGDDFGMYSGDIFYKDMSNAFAISNLESPLSMLLGNKTESGNLDLLFEGTHGDIIKLITLTDEDKINWIETIFEQLTRIREV